MNLVRKKDGVYEWRFLRGQWENFVEFLGLYPQVPPAHHRLSRGKADAQLLDGQALLDQALADHRAEIKTAVLKTLADPQKLRITPKGSAVLTLKAADLMSLLQVLNDIRVGSWIRLGSPEEIKPPILPEQELDLFSMEMAGHYEALLLAALEPAP